MSADLNCLKLLYPIAVSTHSFTSANDSSPALLALRRFIRGTLRQVGLAVMSVVLILGLSAPVTEASAADSERQHLIAPSAEQSTSLVNKAPIRNLTKPHTVEVTDS